MGTKNKKMEKCSDADNVSDDRLFIIILISRTRWIKRMPHQQ